MRTLILFFLFTLLFSIHLFGQPTLISPSDFGIFNRNSTSSITHQWSSVPGALEYWLNIFPSGNSANPKFNASVGTSTSSAVSLSGWTNGEYIWQVRVRTSAGWSAYSAARRYIADTPPDVPALSAPANGASYNISSSTSFSWSGPSGATIARYYLRIVPGSNLNNSPVYDPEFSGTSQFITFNSPPYNSGSYIWGVRAIKVTPSGYNQSSYETTIGWGQYATRTFSLTTPPPNPPNLSSPSDFAIFNRNTSGSISFQWSSVSGSLEYWVNVFPSGNSSSPVYDASVGNNTIVSINPLGWSNNVYVWQVRVRTSGGWSSYSSSRQFIADTPPAQPALSTPVDASSFALGASTSFSWSGPGGVSIARYYLRVVPGSNLNNTPAYDLELLGSNQSVTFNAPPFNTGSYIWGVRAMKVTPPGYNQSSYESIVGWGQYSTRVFSLTTPLPNPPSLVLPNDFAIFNRNTSGSISFQWSSVSGSLEYWLNVFPSGNSASPVFDGSVGNVTSQSLNPAAWTNNVYVWQVKVRTSAGWSVYSSARQFIADTPPSQPVLSSPVNASSFEIGASTSFAWSGPVGVTIARYYLRLVPGTDLNNSPAYDPELSGTNQQVTFSTPPYNTGSYIWGVRAMKVTPSGYDQTAYETTIGWGQYSTRTFSIIPPLPDPPSLVSPVNFGIYNRNTASSILFQWTAVSGAIEYWLNIFPSGNSPNPKFDASVGNVTEHLVTLTGWSDGEYIVQVKVRTNAGWSNYSTSRQFIADTPPQSPNILAPADNVQLSTGSSTDFSWNGPDGVSIHRYYVRIVPGSNLDIAPVFEAELVSQSQNITFSSPPYGIGSYIWGVRGIKVTPAGYDQTTYENTIGWGQYDTQGFSLTPQPTPHIDVSPASFNESILQGNYVVKQVMVNNSGTAELAVTSIVAEVDNGPMWIGNFNPASLNIGAGGSSSFQFNINAINLAPGTYTGRIKIFSNDPVNNPFELPLSLNVTMPQSGLETFGYPVINPVVSCTYNTLNCATPSFHTAIDFDDANGLDVQSSASGIVAFIMTLGGNDHGLGNCVIIKHYLASGGTVYSLYAHLNSIENGMLVGTRVAKGQKIGVMGGSGYDSPNRWSTHLHFEIKNSPVLHNPSGSGTHWGYTPTSANNFGYHNPENYFGIVEVIPPPSKPVNVHSASSTTGSISIAWNPSQGQVSGYYVYSASSANGPFTKCATVSLPEATETGLTPNCNRWYYVTAYNNLANVSSDLLQTATLAENIPAPADIGIISVTPNSVELSWTGIAGAGSYNIYKRKASDAQYDPPVSVYTPRVILTNLNPSTDYVVAVATVKQSGEGSKSEGVNITTLPGTIDIKFVDANPALLGVPYDDVLGYLDQDLLLTKVNPASQNLLRSGACADGVSDLLITIKTSFVPTSAAIILMDDLGSTQLLNTGTIGRVNQTIVSNALQLNAGDFVPVENGSYIALIVYKPPIDFVRPNVAEDNSAIDRFVLADFYIDEALLVQPIVVRRPPLVLVHGLWGSDESWTNFQLFSPYDPALSSNTVFKFNYTQFNASPFVDNVNRLTPFLWNIVAAKIREIGIACTQVDYVGHSMGGILARLLSQDPKLSHTKESYGKGFLHKLVTLNTPHFGSRWASYLTNPLNAPQCASFLGKGAYAAAWPSINAMLNAFSLHPTYFGAIDNLSYGSPQVRSIKETTVPSFAVTGTTNTWAALDEPFGNIYQTLSKLMLYSSASEIAEDFHCEPSDLVVSKTSQRGALSYPSEKNVPNVSHTGAIKDSDVSQQVKLLLDARLSGTNLFGHFPNVNSVLESSSQINTAEAPEINPIQLLNSSYSVNVTAPDSSAIVSPGNVLIVELDVPDTSTLEWISISAPGFSVFDSSQSTNFELTIPYDYVGLFKIFVLAGDGNSFGYDSVVVDVQTPSTLLSVSLEPDLLTLNKTDEGSQVQVIGNYADNSARDITMFLTTAYVANDTNIVRVSSHGRIQPLQPGQTYVYVTNEGITDSLLVIVNDNFSVSLLSPVNGAQVIASPVIFNWNSVTGVTSYKLDLSRFNDFSDIAYTDSTLTDTVANIPYLRASTYYFWRVSAKIADEWQPFSTTWIFKTQGPSVHLSSKWNLVSIPVTVDDPAKNSLFPSAVSQAFSFSSTGYGPNDSLLNGVGYWLKFAKTETVTISGNFRSTDTVDVNEGWNLIGSVTNPVPVGSVVAVPAGIAEQNYFGYDMGYFLTDSILPGKGYWVKTETAGKLILMNAGNLALPKSRAEHVFSYFNTLRFADSEMNAQTLYFGTPKDSTIMASTYEMPPAPPPGVFDVRFASNRMIETGKGSSAGNFPISVTDVRYPLTITWELVDPDISASLILNGKEIHLNRNGSRTISQQISSLSINVSGYSHLPEMFALGQNFPNPFNPVTKLEYALPVQSNVTLKVYNVLGQLVSTLVDQIEEPGYKSVSLDASTWSSGVYFYRLEATSTTDPSKTFLQIKKMLLMK